MFPLFLLLFTVLPAIEIYLLFSIGATLGGLNTFLLVVLTGVVGATLAKTQGLLILSKIQQEMAAGKIPSDQIIQGLMVFAGGILLMTPGFLTDALGLSLVFPGTRHLLALLAKKYFASAVNNGTVHFQTFSAGSGGGFQYQSRGQEFHREESTRQVEPGVFEASFERKD